jgi:hypothetical protein
MFKVEQLEKIATDWRQDAESETDKYYFETAEFRSIADGTKAYVISRKGTGKSAIVMHLLATKVHAVDLSLSDLNPQDLHAFGSHGNETERGILYRNTFAYIIYRAVAVMMLNSPEVSDIAKKQIRDAFPDQVEAKLPRNVMRWMTLEGHFEAFGFGAGAEVQREQEEDKRSIVEKKNVLEQFLDKHLKGGPYYVIFDALDDNFRAAHGKLEPEYGLAITSLFKTVADIRREFLERDLFPVITLRDDIFDFLRHAERNRWQQDKVEIEWDEDKIKAMIAHRLAVTAGRKPVPFEEVWPELVGQEAARFGNRVWEKYDYIASFTMLRPRDFIAYLSEACGVAAKKARERGHSSATLSVPALRDCKGEFADYFRDEVEDELSGQIPDIKQIFEAVLDGPHRSVGRKELEERYADYLKSGSGESTGMRPPAMLEKLYQFGVIGYAETKGPAKGEKFRYNGGDRKLHPSAGLLIHKGLIRAKDEDKVLFEDQG